MGTRKFVLFDGLRAIAALSVVAVHFGNFTQSLDRGWAGAFTAQLAGGVCVFFLISGFLLYRPFVAARLEGRTLSVRAFARNRALRIIPAYWLALTVLAVWPGLPGVFTANWWVYYFFGQDYSARTWGQGIAPAWSLGTEILFYASLPLYAWFMARRPLNSSTRRTVVAEFIGLGALIVGSLLFRAYAADYTGGYNWVGRTLGGTFDWFALGMAAGVASCLWPQVRIRAGWALVGTFAAFVAAAVWTKTQTGFVATDQYSSGPIHVIWGIGALMLLLPVAFAVPGTRFYRTLSSRTAVQLGIVSYGIYLWHLPLIMEASKLSESHPSLPAVLLRVVAVLLAIAAAFGSYYLVEKRILALKKRSSRKEATPEPSSATAAAVTVAP